MLSGGLGGSASASSGSLYIIISIIIIIIIIIIISLMIMIMIISLLTTLPTGVSANERAEILRRGTALRVAAVRKRQQ